MTAYPNPTPRTSYPTPGLRTLHRFSVPCTGPAYPTPRFALHMPNRQAPVRTRHRVVVPYTWTAYPTPRQRTLHPASPSTCPITRPLYVPYTGSSYPAPALRTLSPNGSRTLHPSGVPCTAPNPRYMIAVPQCVPYTISAYLTPDRSRTLHPDCGRTLHRIRVPCTRTVRSYPTPVLTRLQSRPGVPGPKLRKPLRVPYTAYPTPTYPWDQQGHPHARQSKPMWPVRA